MDNNGLNYDDEKARNDFSDSQEQPVQPSGNMEEPPIYNGGQASNIYDIQPQDVYGQQGEGSVQNNGAQPAGQNPYTPDGQYYQQNPYAVQGQYDQNPYAVQGQYGQGSYGPNGQYNQNAYGPNGQYTQNQYTAQGQYGGPGQGGGPIPMKKGMDPKTIKLIIAIVGGVLLVGLALFLIFGVFFTPKKRLKRAMEANTDKSYASYNTPFDEVLGTGDISKAFEEKGGSVDVKVILNSAGENKDLAGLEIGGAFSIDKSAKELSLDVLLGSDGKTVFDGQLLADENKTYLTIVDVMTGYLVADNKGFSEKLNNSFLTDSDLLGKVNLPQFDLDYFNPEGWSLLGGMTEGIGDDIWEVSQVKVSGSETLDLSGRSVKCKAYEVTIAKEDVHNLIDSIIDQYMDSLMENNLASDDLFSQAGITDINEFKLQLKTIFKMMITEDVVYKAYVNGGHVVAYSSDGKLSLMGTPIEYSLMFKNTGEKNVMSAGELTVTLSVQGVSLNIYAKYGSEKKDDNTIATYFEGKLSSAGFTVGATYNQSYNIGTGEFDLTGDLSEGGEQLLLLTGKGKITNIEKGKSFKIMVDDLRLTTQDEGLLDLDAEIGISTDTKVKKPDTGKKMVNIFEVSRADYDAFIAENEENFNKMKDNMKPFLEKLGLDEP